MAKKNAKQFFKDYGDFSEDDWIEDLRAFMGQYDPEVIAKIQEKGAAEADTGGAAKKKGFGSVAPRGSARPVTAYPPHHLGHGIGGHRQGPWSGQPTRESEGLPGRHC